LKSLRARPFGFLAGVFKKRIAISAETIYLLTIEREDFYARLGWTVHDRAGEKTVMSHPIAMAAS
jgi:hypothetical protein